MIYPGNDDILLAGDLLVWIDSNFLRSDPFAFQHAEWTEIRVDIAQKLDVEANGVFVIGSGAVGLSLNPRKMTGELLKVFDEGSDIDLAVISRNHFDQAWRDLKIASHPTLSEIDEALLERLRHQRKRLFDGAIVAKQDAGVP